MTVDRARSTESSHVAEDSIPRSGLVEGKDNSETLSSHETGSEKFDIALELDQSQSEHLTRGHGNMKGSAKRPAELENHRDKVSLATGAGNLDNPQNDSLVSREGLKSQSEIVEEEDAEKLVSEQPENATKSKLYDLSAFDTESDDGTSPKSVAGRSQTFAEDVPSSESLFEDPSQIPQSDDQELTINSGLSNLDVEDELQEDSSRNPEGESEKAFENQLNGKGVGHEDESKLRTKDSKLQIEGQDDKVPESEKDERGPENKLADDVADTKSPMQSSEDCKSGIVTCFAHIISLCRMLYFIYIPQMVSFSRSDLFGQ